MWIFDDITEGIKAVKMATSDIFEVAYEVAGVGYETSGEEFLFRANIFQDSLLYGVKIPIALDS